MPPKEKALEKALEEAKKVLNSKKQKMGILKGQIIDINKKILDINKRIPIRDDQKEVITKFVNEAKEALQKIKHDEISDEIWDLIKNQYILCVQYQILKYVTCGLSSETDCTLINDCVEKINNLIQPLITVGTLKKELTLSHTQIINLKEDLGGAVRVFVRVRGDDTKTQKGVNLVPPDVYKFNGKEYGKFHGVFDQSYDNDMVFNALKSTLDQVKSGYHIVLFGYGYSGSGKTYTLLNPNNGILFKMLKEVTGQHAIVKIQELCFKSIDVTKQTKRKIRDKETFIKTPSLEGQIEKHNNLTIEYLKKIITERDNIKVTMNNPQSSRSHLFITVQIGEGYLTICDMGGRESPEDIFTKTKITPKGYILSGNNYYNIKGGQPAGIPQDNLKKEATITDLTGHTDLITVLQQKQSLNPKKDCNPNFKDKQSFKTDVNDTIKYIIDTINEGYYINETINHLIFYLLNMNHKTGKLQKVFAEDTLPTTYIYNIKGVFVQPMTEYPTIDLDNPNAKIAATDYKIHMIPLLEDLRKMNPTKPTKFVMLACIRQEEEHAEFTRKTLEFAQTISSSR